MKEWTLTLPSELPLWELDSQWTFKSWEGNCKGQNSLDWNVPYTIENLLERRCLKWPLVTHLGTWNISYGQKKGRDWNCQFDSRPLKVRNRPGFLFFQMTCYTPLQRSWQGLQLCFRPHLNRRFTHRIMGLQNCGSLNLGNFRTPTWESWDKMTFGCWSRDRAWRKL